MISYESRENSAQHHCCLNNFTAITVKLHNCALMFNIVRWKLVVLLLIQWNCLLSSTEERKSFWFWSEQMNMCEWMIKFSILGKLLFRQRQTILLPLFLCALYCCSVMINIGKVDTMVNPFENNKCQSPHVSNKIHYANYNCNVS